MEVIQNYQDCGFLDKTQRPFFCRHTHRNGSCPQDNSKRGISSVSCRFRVWTLIRVSVGQGWVCSWWVAYEGSKEEDYMLARAGIACTPTFPGFPQIAFFFILFLFFLTSVSDLFRKEVKPLVGYRPLHVPSWAVSPKTQRGFLGACLLAARSCLWCGGLGWSSCLGWCYHKLELRAALPLHYVRRQNSPPEVQMELHSSAPPLLPSYMYQEQRFFPHTGKSYSGLRSKDQCN